MPDTRSRESVFPHRAAATAAQRQSGEIGVEVRVHCRQGSEAGGIVLQRSGGVERGTREVASWMVSPMFLLDGAIHEFEK